MFHRILVTAFMSLGFMGVAAANPMTDYIKGLYDTRIVTTAENPVVCIQTPNGSFQPWAYGQTLDPNQYSGSASYFGAALRDGGCSVNNIYYGWISVAGGQMQYTPGPASHIQLLNGTVNGGGLVGNLGFTPLGPTDDTLFPTNSDTTSPSDMTWFTGFNLSGLEFSTSPNNSVIPNLSAADEVTTNSDLKDTATFLNQGANIIRLPIRWAYVQPEGPGNTLFDPTGYLKNIVLPTLETITSHNYYVILDLHSYMHYATVGTQVAGCGGPDHLCPDGTLDNTPANYVNVWSQIWQTIQNDPNIKTDHLLFDLVNEPTDQNGQLTAQDVFNMETAVIKQLQTENFPGYYLVEGVNWSGLHSWKQSGNAAVFTRQNFINAGINNFNNIIINVHQYLDSNYSGTHNSCLQNITTTGPNGFNLQSFVNYLQRNQFKAIVTEFGVGSNQQSCSTPLNAFLTYLSNNSYSVSKGYGFVGWTVWSTGHGWGNYNLRVRPNDWKDSILENYFKK